MHIYRIFEILNIMNMKRYFLTIAVCLLTLPLSAQGRLVGSSSEKRPVWIKHDTGQLGLTKVSYESGISLDDARDKAFEKLSNLVANTVTAYLIGTSVTEPDAEALMSAVRKSSFLRNISESTAIQTYWEHRTVKKQDIYIYYILYEFNDFEKKKIALEVNMENSPVIEELNKLE